MGNSTSTSKQEEKNQNVVNTPTNDQLEQEQNKNLQKIMPKQEDNDTTDILESLNITELKKPEENENINKPEEEVKNINKPNEPQKQENEQKEPKEPEKLEKEQLGGKKRIPLLGGFGVNLSETSDMVFSGLENKTGRKRYTKYDLFKILRNLDLDTEDNQKGGGDDDVSDVKSSSNDEKSMEHIKNIILKELETLKTNKSQQLGGSGCGCNGIEDKKNSRKLSSKLNLNNIIIDDDNKNKQLGGTVIIDASSSSTTSDDSESSSSEFGKVKAKKSKKSKKSKSSKKYQREETENSESDSHFFIDTSESGFGDDKEQTSNGESDEKSVSDKRKDETDSEEGLSIFPFNSSDVKSSVSIKNYRMLRRKI